MSIEEQVGPLLRPGMLYELRAINVPTGTGVRAYSGVFDNAADLASEALRLDQMGASGVYFTPNPLNPAAVQVTNEATPAQKGLLPSDQDVLQVDWLLVDLDPVRPKHTSSTADEKQAAAHRLEAIRAFLKRRKWPDPVVADSGNGYHALYRVENPESALVKRCLGALGFLFTDDAVDVDIRVYNPSRIFKVYGTSARKGSNTVDRPHRLSKVLDIPDLKPVSGALLLDLADLLPNARSGEDKKAPVGQIDNWIAEFFPQARGPKPWDNGGRRWVFDVCPWDASHTDSSAYIVQFADGGIQAGCMHETCKGAKKGARGTHMGWKRLQRLAGDTFAGNADHESAPRMGSTMARPNCTDLGNAKRFARMFVGQVVYCADRCVWYVYDGHRWVEDRTGEAERMAQVAVNAIYAEAAVADKDEAKMLFKHATRSESARAIASMIRLARLEPGIVTLAERFDVDPWLLNVQNGTIDLRTGELRPHDRSDFITKICPVPYEADATSPIWDDLLSWALVKDDEVIGFLHRFFGYCLTGTVREQVLVFMEGAGGNGKSSVMNALTYTMGDYACTAAPGLLLAKKNEAHPTEVMDLKGTRLAASSEVDKGRHFAEAQIKVLTSTEPLKARAMRENYVQWDPTQKFVISANYRPVIKGNDDGIWRRILRVPFTQKITEDRKSDTFEGDLRAEAAGILSRLVAGCLEWQHGGLQPPATVMAASKEYRDEMDTLAEFFEDCVEVAAELAVPKRQLYLAYVEWCDDGKQRPESKSLFQSKLSERGFTSQPRKIGPTRKSVRCWLGIALMDDQAGTGNVVRFKGRK